MRQELGQHAITVAQSPKTAAVVSTAVTTAGLGSIFLNLAPGVLGVVAMSLGISLQLVLRRKGRLESERIQLQKEKLQLEIDVLKRKEGGQLSGEIVDRLVNKIPQK